MYVLDRKNKTVLDFKVGSRTKINLQALTDQALMLEPKKICTDGLNTYRSLLPSEIHRVGSTQTRHIERHNLNIRTHLKRLSRKTICFSKSVEMLQACLKIYFWKKSDFGTV
jgi:IS1 family transposase